MPRNMHRHLETFLNATKGNHYCYVRKCWYLAFKYFGENLQFILSKRAFELTKRIVIDLLQGNPFFERGDQAGTREVVAIAPEGVKILSNSHWFRRLQRSERDESVVREEHIAVGLLCEKANGF